MLFALASRQRELSHVRNPCDELTRRETSKIVNQGPPAFVRRGALRLGTPAFEFPAKCYPAIYRTHVTDSPPHASNKQMAGGALL